MERQKKAAQEMDKACLSQKSDEQQQLKTPTFPALQFEPFSPDVKVMNQFSLPPNDPAFLQAWDMMENQQMTGAMTSLLGFSENQVPASFMSFDDQSWFM